MNNVLLKTYTPLLTIEEFTEECQRYVDLYSCPLCEGILVKAIIDRCGHSFCENCVETLKKSGSNCPFSKDPINDYLLNNVVNSVIEKQTVYCKNRELGCIWIGKLHDRKDHLYYDCEKQENLCENEGCDQKIMKENLKIHEEECVFRKVKCHHCEESTSFNNLEKHYLDCKYLPVNCPNDCGLQIASLLVTKHIEKECGMSICQCPFFLVGCSFCDLRKELKNHLDENLEDHLKLINIKIHALDGKIEEMKEENINLSKRISIEKEEKEIMSKIFNEHIQSLNKKFELLSQEVKHRALYTPIQESNILPSFENNGSIFNFNSDKNSLKKELQDNGWYGKKSKNLNEISNINEFEKLIVNMKIVKTQNSCIMFGITVSDKENLKNGYYQQTLIEDISFLFYCYNSSIYSKGRSHNYGSGVCVEGDIISLIIDSVNKHIEFRKNGMRLGEPFMISNLDTLFLNEKLKVAVDMCEYDDEILFF